MKTDIQVMKGAHNQEVKRFQSDMEGMREEVDVTKSELEECHNHNVELSTANKSQGEELDRYRQMQEERSIEVGLNVMIMILSFWIDMPGHTVQTQIKLV